MSLLSIVFMSLAMAFNCSMGTGTFRLEAELEGAGLGLEAGPAASCGWVTTLEDSASEAELSPGDTKAVEERERWVVQSGTSRGVVNCLATCVSYRRRCTQIVVENKIVNIGQGLVRLNLSARWQDYNKLRQQTKAFMGLGLVQEQNQRAAYIIISSWHRANVWRQTKCQL